jgi:hypothetical protein
MYLWNARRLALALRAGRLTEADKARYLIAGSVLSSMCGGSAVSALQNTFTALPLIGSIVVTVAGIWMCYRANQRGDGTAFLERFVCLVLPVTVRWLLLFWGLWMGVVLIGWTVDRSIPSASFARWYPLLMLPLFYAMLHTYVAIAARPVETSADSWSK